MPHRLQHVKRRYLQAWAGGFAAVGVAAIDVNAASDVALGSPEFFNILTGYLQLVGAVVILAMANKRINRLDLAVGALMVGTGARGIAFLQAFLVRMDLFSLSRTLLYVAILAAHYYVVREAEHKLVIPDVAIKAPDGT